MQLKKILRLVNAPVLILVIYIRSCVNLIALPIFHTLEDLERAEKKCKKKGKQRESE